MSSTDLAADTPLESWPKWFRWSLFLPAGLLGSFIAAFLFKLAAYLFNSDAASQDWWYTLLQSGVYGYTFVYFGSVVAPRHQFIVGLCLLILGTVILTGTLTLSFVTHTAGVWSVFNDIVSLTAAGATLYFIHDELE